MDGIITSSVLYLFLAFCTLLFLFCAPLPVNEKKQQNNSGETFV